MAFRFVCPQLRKAVFFGVKTVKNGKIGKECSNDFNKVINESGTPNLVGLDPKNVKIAPCVPELEPISYSGDTPFHILVISNVLIKSLSHKKCYKRRNVTNDK